MFLEVFTRTSFSRTFPFDLNWISTAVSHDPTNRSHAGLLVLNRHSTHIIIVYGVMFCCSRTAMPWPRPLLSPKAVPLSRIRPAVTPLLSSSPGRFSTGPINWTQSLHSTGKLQFAWVPLSLLKRIQHKFRLTHSQRNLLSCIWLLLTRYDYKSVGTESIMRFSKYLIYEQSRSIRLSLVFMLHNQGLNTTP